RFVKPGDPFMTVAVRSAESTDLWITLSGGPVSRLVSRHKGSMIFMFPATSVSWRVINDVPLIVWLVVKLTGLVSPTVNCGILAVALAAPVTSMDANPEPVSRAVYWSVKLSGFESRIVQQLKV